MNNNHLYVKSYFLQNMTPILVSQSYIISKTVFCKKMLFHGRFFFIILLEKLLYSIRWDPERRSWQYVAPMQIQRCSAGVAVLKDRLYVVGGRDGASCLRTVECYDPYTNKWSLAAPLARRKGCIGVATANGYLYVMGGQDAPANNPTTSR